MRAKILRIHLTPFVEVNCSSSATCFGVSPENIVPIIPYLFFLKQLLTMTQVEKDNNITGSLY